MVANPTKTREYIGIFCLYIDQLITIWRASNYLANTSIIGRSANFLAVRLGLTGLEGPFPYQPTEWTRIDIVRRKGWDRGRTRRLRNWQKKAMSIKAKKKAKTAKAKKVITADKIDRFCTCINQMIYILRSYQDDAHIHALGLEANELAVNLDLIHENWLIAMKLGVSIANEELCKELGLFRDSDKPPYVRNGFKCSMSQLDIPRLKAFMREARLLKLKKDPSTIEEGIRGKKIKRIPLDEKRLLAFVNGLGYPITVEQFKVLKKLNKEPGAALVAKQLKDDPRNGSRPDRILKRLPEPIKGRIKHTKGHGYHLI